ESLEKVADAPFRARLLRALLTNNDAAVRKAAVERAFNAGDLDALVVGVEWSVENESPDDQRSRLVNLKAREFQVVLEGLLNALRGPTEPPSAVAVDFAHATGEQSGPELLSRLSPLLLAGSDGSGLAGAPDALAAASKKLRAATQRGLEAFAKKKSAKDAQT